MHFYSSTWHGVAEQWGMSVVRGKAPPGRTCGSVGSLINCVYLCSLFFFNHRQMRQLGGSRREHVYMATSVRTPEGVPPFIMLIFSDYVSRGISIWFYLSRRLSPALCVIGVWLANMVGREKENVFFLFKLISCHR